jgi:hypothetical protein
MPQPVSRHIIRLRPDVRVVRQQNSRIETVPVAIKGPDGALLDHRPAFYAEARRILVSGGVIAIVEYVRDQGSPLAAALIEFMAEYGSQKAYAPADYRRELAGSAGFHDAKALVLRRPLRLDIAAFTGLALSSSHAAGVIERFGIDGARSALRELATPHRVDDEHVLFGYVFQCFTGRRDA